MLVRSKVTPNAKTTLRTKLCHFRFIHISNVNSRFLLQNFINMKKFREEYLQSHTCEKEMTKVNIIKLILNICFLIFRLCKSFTINSIYPIGNR